VNDDLRKVLDIFPVEEGNQKTYFYYLTHPQLSRQYQVGVLQILRNAIKLLLHQTINLVREVIAIKHIYMLTTFLYVEIVQTPQGVPNFGVLGL